MKQGQAPIIIRFPKADPACAEHSQAVYRMSPIGEHLAGALPDAQKSVVGILPFCEMGER
ncbi:MAG TPA: hypothetical protein EYO33_26915 [Phycisphaerales bacterium]|nr:hypothetical protein [Phycisphaerales bacterium]